MSYYIPSQGSHNSYGGHPIAYTSSHHSHVPTYDTPHYATSRSHYSSPYHGGQNLYIPSSHHSRHRSRSRNRDYASYPGGATIPVSSFSFPEFTTPNHSYPFSLFLLVILTVITTVVSPLANV